MEENDLGGITIEGKPLKNYLEKEKEVETDRESSQIINEATHIPIKKRTNCPHSDQKHDTNPSKGERIIQLTDADIREILKETDKMGVLFALLSTGSTVTIRDWKIAMEQSTGEVIAQSGLYNYKKRLFQHKGCTKFVRQVVVGRSSGFALVPKYVNVGYKTLWKIWSRRFPDTIRDLWLKHPELKDAKGEVPEEPTPIEKSTPIATPLKNLAKEIKTNLGIPEHITIDINITFSLKGN